MKDKKLTTYQMAVTAVMAAVLCVLGPLTVPIGAVPISLANFVICLTAWLLGPKFGTFCGSSGSASYDGLFLFHDQNIINSRFSFFRITDILKVSRHSLLAV